MPRYIDAEALTEVLTEHKDFYAPNLTALVNEAMTSGLRIAIREVKNAPTADVVEVKHGEWRLHSGGSGTCNQCGKTQRGIWDYDNAQNFCGHCGAKMDGGKQKNDM